LQSEVEARKQEIHLLEAPRSSDGLSPGVQFLGSLERVIDTAQ
jgi:hypothetical protein